MEAALLLLFFVIVEFGLTIWLLAKHFDYLRRIKRLETNIYQMKLNSAASEADNDMDKEPLDSLVARATPEDMEQARQVLQALGFGDKVGSAE